MVYGPLDKPPQNGGLTEAHRSSPKGFPRMSIGRGEDTGGERQGCMEHGATWLRRRGAEDVAGEPEEQSSMARQHPHPAPPPAAGTSPSVVPGVCYSPRLFLHRKQFFSKYLGETLFAVSVWGLRDRILIEDSKLCP